MITGLDLGHANVTEAEHWLRETAAGLGPSGDVFACTHLIHGEGARVALSVSFPVALPSLDDAVAARVAELHASGRGGRAVLYPGMSSLIGTLPVGELLSLSAIEAVRVIGGSSPTPSPETLLETRDFVRPQWEDGRLVLVAMPAPGGRLMPFEVPNPTPCCAFH
ncbi:hypothetical protein [Hamadaea tsunoensis]|uniref:hypothetical protein n=1 Tax=Hamadaea tsunoensis TaxID=53368 RepID=UPI00041BD62E|nr:hypothetical protein [Hamadaea tsunoensis]